MKASDTVSDVFYFCVGHYMYHVRYFYCYKLFINLQKHGRVKYGSGILYDTSIYLLTIGSQIKESAPGQRKLTPSVDTNSYSCVRLFISLV